MKEHVRASAVYRGRVSTELGTLLLFSVATAVAIATTRLKIPYTVALVVVGAGLGVARLSSPIHLTKDLLYAVFLPGLIFEAAYNLTLSELRQNLRAVFALAVPGVLVAMAATAAMLVFSTNAIASTPNIGWSHALVFSALIAATDPIAVVAMFKSLGAPRRLAVLVEGESLINDGTGAVLYAIVLGAVTGQKSGGVTQGILEFVVVVGAGVFVGALTGYLASQLRRRATDPMIEIALTTLAAYGSFALAERFHVSGIIATVTAGLVCRALARQEPSAAGGEAQSSEAATVAVESYWNYVAFALNSFVFLLIGLEVRLGSIASAWRTILLAFVAVTLGRALVVFMVAALLRRTTERITWRESAVLTWGGLRGALSMVLALAIPDSFPERELIVTTTFGVVALSIVLQGLTAGPLLRRLRVV
jgi:CPA1 family monovalent cation:H+ antiporter